MMPVVVKFFTLGGMTWREDTICPISNIPALCSLGVEVYQNLIPELSTVPVASQCVLHNLVRPRGVARNLAMGGQKFRQETTPTN